MRESDKISGGVVPGNEPSILLLIGFTNREIYFIIIRTASFIKLFLGLLLLETLYVKIPLSERMLTFPVRFGPGEVDHSCVGQFPR